jgi:hypothetical protein
MLEEEESMTMTFSPPMRERNATHRHQTLSSSFSSPLISIFPFVSQKFFFLSEISVFCSASYGHNPEVVGRQWCCVTCNQRV